MREKLLTKVDDELLRLRHAFATTAEGRAAPGGFAIDSTLVGDFLAGTITDQRENELAQQVAQVLPFHYVQANKVAETMSRLAQHLGGQRQLVAWLDRFPGLPRLVARLYVFMGLLDQWSENPAVVTALREYREQTPYPEGLKGYLLPQTDDETLAGLAFRIEELLGDGQRAHAVELARATASCLREIAPHAAELDPGLDEMGELMDHTRDELDATV
ncbi:hypothetical protein [Streptomyces sp. NPDC052012]|uniref:hypothetical protein n=1 Tax=Streptomyces sp. NPDC052012 TaxID=3155051 RepID=UPI00344D2F6C